MVFDPAILNILKDSVTLVQEVTEDVGVSFGARHRVSLVTILKPTQTESFGFRGVPSQTEQQPIIHEMTPQPIAEIRDQLRYVDGQVVNLGDARLKNIVTSRYSREMLQAADYILVDGDKYDLIKGSIKEASGGIFLECVLKRIEQDRDADHGP